MSLRILFVLAVATHLSVMIQADGDGGHKKVIIHVPLFIKHHHHKHTIVKHIHHKSGGGGGDDHYEVLGYTYGEPKAAPHFGGGHGWSAAEESHDSPVSFSGGDHASYSLSGDDYGGHGY